MENDRWEETNFKAIGSQCDDTRVDFDQSYNPKDYVVRCVPPTTNWYASDQTLNDNADDTYSGFLKGAAVRVLLRGADMMEGNGIKNSGPFDRVCFCAPKVFFNLHIKAAYIAECASESNYTPNAASTGVQLFFNENGSH